MREWQAPVMIKTPLGLIAGYALLLLIYCFALAPLGLVSGQSAPGPSRPKTPEYTFKVVHVFPHDPAAFTQGLVYHDGFFYESTGLNGRSQLRKVRLETGEVVRHVDLPT